MATNRPTPLFWSTTIIAAGIAAGFLVFSLLPIFTAAGKQPDVVDERPIKLFLRCMRVLQVVGFPHDDSHPDIWEAVVCHQMFRAMQHGYQSYGRLPRGYVEALKIRCKMNQTEVDISICGLDFSRCSNQTLELLDRYHDEIPCEWRDES